MTRSGWIRPPPRWSCIWRPRALRQSWRRCAPASRAPTRLSRCGKDAGGQRLELGLLSDQETETLIEEIVGDPSSWEHAAGWRRPVAGTLSTSVSSCSGALAGGALKQVSGLWRLAAETAGERVAQRAGLPRGWQGSPTLSSEPSSCSPSASRCICRDLGSGRQRTGRGRRGAWAGDRRRPRGRGRGATLIRSTASDPGRAAVAAGARGTAAARGDSAARQSIKPADTLRMARWLIDAGEPISTDLMLQAARAANLAGDPGSGRACRAGPASRSQHRAASCWRGPTSCAAGLPTRRPCWRQPRPASTRRGGLGYLEQESEVLHWGLKRPSELHALLDRPVGWWPEPAWRQRPGAAAIARRLLRAPWSQRLGHDRAAVNHRDRNRRPRPAQAGSRRQPLLQRPHRRGARTRGAHPPRTAAQKPERRDRPLAMEPSHPRDRRAMGRAQSLDDKSAGRGGTTCRPRSGGPSGVLARVPALLSRTVRRCGRAAGRGRGTTRAPRSGGAVTRRQCDASRHRVLHRGPRGDRPALERCHARRGGSRRCGTNRRPRRRGARHGDPPRARQLLLDVGAQLSASPVHAARLTYEAMRAGAPPRRLAEPWRTCAHDATRAWSRRTPITL